MFKSLKRIFPNRKRLQKFIGNFPKPFVKVYRMSKKTLTPCQGVAIHTAVVMATGDVIAQCVFEGRGFSGSFKRSISDNESILTISNGGCDNQNNGIIKSVNFSKTSSSSSCNSSSINRVDDNTLTKEFDWLRFSRFLGVGLFLAGPSMFYWYSALDRYIVIGSLKSLVLKKLAADQLLFLPVYILVYMMALGLLRGDGMEKVRQQVQKHFKETMIMSYEVWPVVQLVNFLLLPGAFRVPFINLVALFWNTYLGWKTESRSRL